MVRGYAHVDDKTMKKHKESRVKVRIMLGVGGTEGLCDWDGAHGGGPRVARHFLDRGGCYQGVYLIRIH